MPDVSISIDLADLDRTLKRYVTTSNRTLSEIVVNKSLDPSFDPAERLMIWLNFFDSDAEVWLPAVG